MEKPFKKKTYFALTLDPVHIGTGGYRLGRVDNTIVREPGTNIPKIPGSSIAGVCRAFTAMTPVVNKYPNCAGKGGEKGEDHCGNNTCPVCVGFGFSKGETNQSFQGLVQFTDTRILFFPVHSMIGPVWITSESILKEHGITTANLDNKNKCKGLGIEIPENKLNLGWLMLESEGTVALALNEAFPEIPYHDIKNRGILLSDKVFSRIVNDNLEVRTSVAIDPLTGTAEHSALFTYEAIPRATVLWFDVIYNNPIYFKINGQDILLPPRIDILDPLGGTGAIEQISYLAYYVEQGMSYIEAMGLGGMNTRGFGRTKIIPGGVS